MEMRQSTLPYMREHDDGDEEMMDPNLVDWRRLYSTYGSKRDIYNLHVNIKVSDLSF
jgi:hypothetical protein